MSELVGINRLCDLDPKEGESVIWIWAGSDQLTAGDYSRGRCRDAAKDFEEIECEPSHWMKWPKNWPQS